MRLTYALIIAALFAAAAQAQTFRITPFVSCIDIDETNNTATSYFGYESFEQSIVQINAGAGNRFVPSPFDRGQPTLFFPGYHEKAFRITHSLTGLLWIFNGNGVASTQSTARCGATATATVARLPSGVVSVPYSQKLVALGGRAALTWQAGGLPTGLTLSTDGVLSGTPLDPGTSTLNFSVSDGITSTGVTYLLTISPGLSISDALSTRPAGFTPEFRVVTQPGASNTATATCEAAEFVITGGGSCVVPNQNTVQGRLAVSQASGNGWTVSCSGGTATAVAVCSRK